MTLTQILAATVVWAILITIVYIHCNFKKIKECYGIWFTKEYWTNYNLIDMLAWMAKGAIIIPGLIFGVQIWELYWIALATSLALIWASEKKLLPTMVAFNTLWTWIACMVLAQHLI